MSNLKISEDQYIGKQELNKLQSFLGDNGFRTFFQRFINTYGVALDNVFPNALQVVPGTTPGAITIKAGAIIDQTAQSGILFNDLINAYTLPQATLFNIYAKRDVTNAEMGTVSIDTLGNVTGVGTKFTDVLRGQPGNATTIRFPNSNFNVNDYVVLNVIDDTHMVVQAPSFTAENNIKYGVVGTFSPGVIVSTAAKMIYGNDTITFAVDTDGTFTYPWYKIATAIFDGTNVTITDLRENCKLTLLLQPSIRQDGTIALLNKIQTFTKIQTWAQGSQTVVASKQLALPGDGNTYVAGIQDTTLQYIQDQPLGTLITIAFLDNNVGSPATLMNKLTMKDAQTPAAPSGFKPIKCYVDTPIVPYDVLIFQRVQITHNASPSAVFDGWVVVSNSEAYPLALDAENKVNTLNNSPWVDYQFTNSDLRTGKLTGAVAVTSGMGWFKYKSIANMLIGNCYIKFTVAAGTSSNVLSIKLPNNLLLTDTDIYGQRAAASCAINSSQAVPVEVVSLRGVAYNGYLNAYVRDRYWNSGDVVELSFAFSFELGASSYVPPANLPPISANIAMTVIQGSFGNVVNFDLNGTNYDPDGVLNSLSVIIVTQPLNGDLIRTVLTTDGAGNPTSVQYSYTPYSDSGSSDSFTFKLVDSQGAFSQVKTVNITINTAVQAYYSVVVPSSAGTTAACNPNGAYPTLPIYYSSAGGIGVGKTAYYDPNLTNPVVNSYLAAGTIWYLTNGSGVITSSGSCVPSGFCFIRGTAILMYNGRVKPIELLRKGDQVMSFNSENILTKGTVTETMNHRVTDTLYITTENGYVVTTPEHPFRVIDGYKKAQDLRIGNVLFMYDEKKGMTTVVILDIEAHYGEPVDVYNLTIEDDHTYFANGIAVHNKPLAP